jgi:peptidoglycan L-alanyl-D-glutamate endopeptidase CwlK
MNDATKATLSNISRARLAEVHPELARRVENMADALAVQLVQIEVDTALRTATQQDELFAQGRTLPGKQVTNARGYQSNHVIGCAVDISPDDSITGKPDWNANHPVWQSIVRMASSFGLRDGKSWHDMPHLELMEIPTEPTEAIQQICKADGVQAVWKELDIPTWPEQ